MAVDKLVDSTQLNADLTSVANAIRTKGGTSAQIAFPAGFVSAVEAIPTGGGGEEAPFNDVNFYDYDGEIVYSYTKAEFLALDTMPDNPIHSGLIAQGWNWTLQNAKTYVTKYGVLDIGQVYKTASGKTEIDIELTDQEWLSPYLMIAPNGTCTINWGDGSSTEDVTGTSVTSIKFVNHLYSTTGKYTISISGTFGFNAVNSASSPLAVSASFTRYRQYSSTIKAVRVSETTVLNSHSFSGCGNCESVTIPHGITKIYSSSFIDCFYLKHITIPSSVTTVDGSVFQRSGVKSVSIPAGVGSLGTNAFSGTNRFIRCCLPDGITEISGSLINTSAIMQLVIPDSVTTIKSSAFNNCPQMIKKVIIPSLVTKIEQSVFYYCSSVKEYHLLPTTPPELSNSNIFTGILADTVIYVPQGKLNDYQTATNWSVYASYMQEEPT